MTALDTAAIKAVIETRILNGRQIAPDEDLLLTGTLDSLGVMALVGHLETMRGRPIPHEDVIIENFQTVEAIAAYLDAG